MAGVAMRRALFAVIPLLALMLAACGDTLSLNPVAKAAERTEATGGVRMTMTGNINQAGRRSKLLASGIFDNAGKRGRFKMITGLDEGALTIDEIIDGYVIYARFPGLIRNNRWVRFDLKKSAKELGIDLHGLSSASPLSGLEQLRQGSKNVRTIGRERVRGVATTHYRAEIDSSKLSVLKAVKLDDVRFGPADTWIDEKQRVRRMKFSLAARVSGKGETREELTMDLYDYGVAVKVKLPPPDKVVDIEHAFDSGSMD